VQSLLSMEAVGLAAARAAKRVATMVALEKNMLAK
jgi:hypothetical protein